MDPEKKLCVWDIASGKQLSTGQLPHELVREEMLSPEGQHLLQAHSELRNEKEHTAGYVWNVATGKRLFPVLYPSPPPGQRWYTVQFEAAWSADGKRMLGLCHDYLARVWDFPSGSLRTVLIDPSGIYRDAVFSGDGRRAITVPYSRRDADYILEGRGDQVREDAHGTKRATVWDTETGQIVATLQGTPTETLAPALSPDGKLALTLAADHTVRLWHTGSGELAATLRWEGRPLASPNFHRCRFSPEGRWIVTLHEDRRNQQPPAVRLWPVDVLSAAEARKLRNLTAQERKQYVLSE